MPQPNGGKCRTCALCINRVIDRHGHESGECSWQMPATLRKKLDGGSNVYTFTPVELTDGCGAHVFAKDWNKIPVSCVD